MTEIDLTPTAKADKKKTWSARNLLIVGTICVALGFVLFQALSSARVFFYNVDEAIELQDELGDDRFRMQGTVTTQPEDFPDGSLLFNVAFNGESASVRHIGDAPSALFECNTPVVIEGRWIDGKFESELITVKHSEEYKESNPDRVDYDADRPAGSSC